MANGKVRWLRLDGGPCWCGWVPRLGTHEVGKVCYVRGNMKDSWRGQIWEVLRGLSLQRLWLLLFGTYYVPGTVVDVLSFNPLSSSVG